MRSIVTVELDKRRPALILTRRSKLHLLAWVSIAPISSTIRGIAGEVRVLFDDQEAELARAISDAFELTLR